MFEACKCHRAREERRAESEVQREKESHNEIYSMIYSLAWRCIKMANNELCFSIYIRNRFMSCDGNARGATVGRECFVNSKLLSEREAVSMTERDEYLARDLPEIMNIFQFTRVQ